MTLAPGLADDNIRTASLLGTYFDMEDATEHDSANPSAYTVCSVLPEKSFSTGDTLTLRAGAAVTSEQARASELSPYPFY